MRAPPPVEVRAAPLRRAGARRVGARRCVPWPCDRRRWRAWRSGAAASQLAGRACSPSAALGGVLARRGAARCGSRRDGAACAGTASAGCSAPPHGREPRRRRCDVDARPRRLDAAALRARRGRAARATRWLPVQRRGLEAHWHALRCAVYCARRPRRTAPAPTQPADERPTPTPPLVERVKRGDVKRVRDAGRQVPAPHRAADRPHGARRRPGRRTSPRRPSSAPTARCPQFRGESAFYTWLYRIAVNTAKKALVELKRDPLVTESARAWLRRRR